MSDHEADGGEESVAVPPEAGGATTGENSSAQTLSAQANQVESNTPVSDPLTPGVPSNLVMMEEMTQASLLNACKVRFEADGVYTFVADILVATNPYRWIDMYGKQYKERYNPANPMCPEPHVYAVAQAAAKNLRLLNRDQVCIVSGESGAGKTETAKLFMHHLLTYSAGDSATTSALERQILESQPALEAFGNAKTGLNDNSSRFGKYIEVLFKGMDQVLGAGVRKYLLEKSRVVTQAEGERNFHCFYYLVEGAPAALRAKLNLQGAAHYKYLNTNNPVEQPSVWFEELDKSLKVLGLTDDQVMSLWVALTAILKTGQLDFAEKEGATGDECEFSDKAVAADLAATLGVELDTLENALTTKHVVIMGETNHKPLTAEDARAARDTMAQNLYDNLFSWLVEQINIIMASPEDGDWRSVAVLDIFGFENFQSNEFEQMFINTANEKLQHYFINHIFTYEIKELKEEGIRAPAVEYTTNVDQVELLLGKQGIFALLDEQTKVPNSTDDTTMIKMHETLSSNSAYDNMRKDTRQFAISHYAGKVKYQASGLLEKNRNAPSLGLAGMLKGSSNEVIASLFKSSETTVDRLAKDEEIKAALKSGDRGFMRRQSQMVRFGGRAAAKKAAEDAEKKKPGGRKLAPWQIANLKKSAEVVEAPKPAKLKREGSEKGRAGLTTLSAAFKGSLEALMEMLNVATPHFVRCIKPNMTKSAGVFDGEMVQKQLNYTGVLETTKIRQNGYPLRVSFVDFCDRYRDVCIPPTYRLSSMDMQGTAIRILQHADLHGWGKGKTKMFLKYEHVNKLVDILEGKKKAANEERRIAAEKQAVNDAELAEINRIKDIELAKVRAAAEAQAPAKNVTESLSWQEDLARQKEMAAAKKAKLAAKDAEEAAAAAAAAANAPAPAGAPKEDAVKKNFGNAMAMFGASNTATPPPQRKPAGGGKPAAATPAAAAPAADAGEAATEACGSYRLDMAGKLFGDCKCGFAKILHHHY